jgi:hypothetical protein
MHLRGIIQITQRNSKDTFCLSGHLKVSLHTDFLRIFEKIEQYRSDILFNFHYLISLLAMDTFVENHVDLLVSANFLLGSERYTDLDPSFFMPTMVG